MTRLSEDASAGKPTRAKTLRRGGKPLLATTPPRASPTARHSRAPYAFLHRGWCRKAVDGIDLSVYPGEVVACRRVWLG